VQEVVLAANWAGLPVGTSDFRTGERRAAMSPSALSIGKLHKGASRTIFKCQLPHLITRLEEICVDENMTDARKILG